MTPNLSDFDPRAIKSQIKVIKDIRTKYDYSKGTQEILLSGAVGSAKSILMAHVAVTHCLKFDKAHFGIGRLSMPALKGTLFNTICEHIGDLFPVKIIENRGHIFFPNGSKITSYSWQDKKYKKVRSHEFSAFAIEELTENDTDAAYKEILMRIGRLRHIPEKFIICATNPDDPSHWVYDRFWTGKHDKRHVYLSNTFDNPFLPESYVEDLRKNLSPREARRMLYGEWLELTREVIYHEYNPEFNFTTKRYTPNPMFPIFWSHDFNIGEGKPMSSLFFQYIRDTIHVFDEIVIQGARTQDVCEEALARNLISPEYRYVITGDAAGRHNDTRSKASDYQIIKSFMANLNPARRFDISTPMSNPPVRSRHTLLNAYCKNDLGQHRLMIYNCPTVDKGLRLTKLKSGGSYIEDDSKDYQHITTALGYGINQAKVYNEDRTPKLYAR
jgi:hypothetical protein